MCEPKLISPLLDNFVMGNAISDHHGVQCCPAMENLSDDKYIVKIISLPSKPSQIDALLLTGAFSDEESALSYFKGIADDVLSEVNILNKLSELEGFLPYTNSQLVPKESGLGYDVYLLSSYKRTLEKHFKRHIMTHLDALNLGLDLCAALSVCRRSGYLFVDLKPSNVFVTGERLYRIGDLGFIRLDSIKYTSLPEKYFSPYTPPEISDAFSTLNTTMDTYAAGLILYQTYNNGVLPFHDDIKPGDKIPAPLYADYEMSEIILKACSPVVEERWKDPMEMGQAIINYMQRNGALDTPIVPVSPVLNESEEQHIETNTAENEVESSTSPALLSVSDDELFNSVSNDESNSEECNAESVNSSENVSSDDFLEEIHSILSEENAEPYETINDSFDEEHDTHISISDEVSEILNQADELAALTVPESVMIPEPIEVSIPEPISPEADPEQPEEAIQEEPDIENIVSEIKTTEAEPIEEEKEVIPKKKRHWLRNSIVVLLLFALLCGGYFYYKNFYLLPIESIEILEGTENSLKVKIKTDIDESLLQVVCSDTYGNQIPSSVENGVAEFTNLLPDTAYSINIISNGFHRLVGNTATAYSTPVQTNIVQFDAVTGNTDGSVILSFTVEGPDCEEWTVSYFSDDEEARNATFSSHVVTLTDLSIGKEYTFQLVPEKDLSLTGQTEIKFTASKVLIAENLTINSCMNNTLDVNWSSPECDDILNWSVRCFNDTYSETIITTDSFASFHNIDHDANFSVEVKAIGMSVGQIVSIPEKSVTVSNMQIDTSDPTQLLFTWDTSREIPSVPNGWVFKYSIEGIESEYSLTCVNNSCLITPVIPNATYHIYLEDSNGNILLNSTARVSTDDSVPFYRDFDGYDVHTKDLIFKMCKTPSLKNWTRFDLENDDFTTSFSVGEAASFLVQITKQYSASLEEVTTMYVIRNQEGIPVYAAITSDAWMNMWYRNYCELDIPVMPSVPGNYTIEVFFDGGLVVSQPFTITK